MAAFTISGFGAEGAARDLAAAQQAAARSIERLSTALKINRSSDDPAGLSISEKLRAQVRELNRLAMNAMDEIGRLQTAEGGLSEISNALQNVRELSVQAGNGTLTDADRAAIQQQIDANLEQIESLATGTQFNSRPLLTGELGTDVRPEALGLSGLNVTTSELAGAAIGTVDDALGQVSEFRSGLGARQNELTSTINSLAVAAENTIAAESRIRDLDYAEEITNLVRANLLQQAALGALAQANLTSESVLKLLK
jgi:flagellin